MILFLKFKTARAKGWCVNFNWLWANARKIHKETHGDDSLHIGSHVVTNFVKHHGIRMRRKQRNKKMSKEFYREDVMKWHVLTREKLIRTGFNDHYDSKWGRFKPSQRFNVDQSQLPFVIDKTRTYEMIEKGQSKQHKVWISQPGAGLDKRQCSLQVALRPEGLQPKLGIIFRGKGRVSPEERAAYHKSVDVFFQDKAWADTTVSIDWINKTLSRVVDDEDLFVLFLDNLSGQCSDEFKESIASKGGVAWYLPKIPLTLPNL